MIRFANSISFDICRHRFLGSLFHFHNIFTMAAPFGEKEVDSITFY